MPLKVCICILYGGIGLNVELPVDGKVGVAYSARLILSVVSVSQ